MSKPTPFGKYYLLERINVGGMAEVFRAKAFGVEGFERQLAVKRILSNIAEDEEFITMFIDEAKIAGQLQHANIAQVFDLGKVDDAFFIAMEFIHGRDLRAIFDRLRKLDMTMPIPQLCYVLMQVCEGLDYAHNKKDTLGRSLGLVHRDVSPQNILVGYEGEVKLVDFGIAKAAGKASKTQAGILKGKFGYMSPEQVRGLPVDRRSDIFSVGICLYEMLTSERLFTGESDFSTLEKVRNVEILPPTSFNSKIQPELERIVLKGLAKDAEDRYQNAIDLHDDLQAFLYSIGELCSRKDLAAWMKRTFSTEIEEENAKLERFKQISAPTPSPVIDVEAAGAIVEKSGKGLEWDEEELETQIFDKPPEEEELSSSDLFGGGEYVEGKRPAAAPAPMAASGSAARAQPGFFESDDRTVAQVPSEDLLADMGAAAAAAAVRQSGSRSAVPDGPSAPAGSGPPGGLSEFKRFPTGRVNGANTLPGLGSGDLLGSVAPLPSGRAPFTAYSNPSAAHGAAGLPSPSHYGGPPGRTLSLPYATQAAGGGKSKVFMVVVGLMVVLGFIAYQQFSKSGKLQLVISPADAQIKIDDLAVSNSGSGPLLIEREPGPYNLEVSSPGYDKVIQPVEVAAGEIEKVEITLRPSADTGFQLKSEPPGMPVWLDSKPLTASDDGSGPQIKTNFKADRMAPGKHVLEIKGDPRFEDWRYEFIQEAGRIVAITAELKLAGSAGAPTGSAPKPAPAPRAIPEVAAPAPAPRPVALVPAPAPTPEPVALAPAPAPAPKPAPRVAPARPPAPAPAPRPRVAAAPVRRPRPKVVAPEEAAPAAAGGTCQVTLGAKPWAKVSIDGKDTGKITPLVGFELPCGKHKVTFENPELKVEKSFNIVVTAGEKFKKVFPLVDTDE